MTSTLNPEASAETAVNFSSVAKTALKHLHERLGFALWMVTRTEGNNWIVLEANDHGYGVKAPALFSWTDSFCSRMVDGHGPRVAASSASVPAYVEAPIASALQIGAYIGVPLRMPDGSLFGTLCAIDPHPKPASIEAELPFVELIGSMLSAQLINDLKVENLHRIIERTQAEAEMDALTGLFNRRGWDRLLTVEDERCRRYGHPACIVALDLDGLKTANDQYGHQIGDELLRKAAQVLSGELRKTDVLARVGGDEFAILLVERSAKDCESLPARIQSTLDQAGISASIGMADRIPTARLSEAWQQADVEMYADKRQRKPAGARAVSLRPTA